MSNAQHEVHGATALGGRLLGVVRVLVGGHVFDLPVQALSLDQDTDRIAGGFFSYRGQLGILVDEAAEAPLLRAQIENATVEAVRHLSEKYLN